MHTSINLTTNIDIPLQINIFVYIYFFLPTKLVHNNNTIRNISYELFKINREEKERKYILLLVY